MKRAAALCLTSCLALLFSAPASAEPVLRAGAKPGVATEWSSAAGVTTLAIAAEYEAEAVAAAIRESVRGAQVKADGAQVVITGVDEATLLRALEGVEVRAGGDEVDEMLSALQNPGGDEDGSGSSIRAGKAVALDAVKGPPGHLVVGEVVKVRRGRYPVVLVSVKVTKTPKRGGGPSRGATVRVLPLVRSSEGAVDAKDAQSQLNVGAWYARKGDRVKLRLSGEQREGIWVAKAYERVK